MKIPCIILFALFIYFVGCSGDKQSYKKPLNMCFACAVCEKSFYKELYFFDRVYQYNEDGKIQAIEYSVTEEGEITLLGFMSGGKSIIEGDSLLVLDSLDEVVFKYWRIDCPEDRDYSNNMKVEEYDRGVCYPCDSMSFIRMWEAIEKDCSE